MLPEVRVLCERAQTRRHAIEGLLDAVPAAYWLRAAPGQAWSARAHVQHLAAMDGLVARLLVRAVAGAQTAWLCDTRDPDVLATARAAATARVGDVPPGELRAALASARAEVAGQLALIDPVALEMEVLVAGAANAWGDQASWPLRGYLQAWSEHDTVHDVAIREAMTTPPDLSAVALTRRMR